MKIVLGYLFFFLSVLVSWGQNDPFNQGFIENKGQITDQSGRYNDQVLFLYAANNGMNVQLRKTGFSYDTYHASNDQSITIDRIDIEFIGMNQKVEVISQDRQFITNNYYISDAQNGIMDVHLFNEITYKNLYPNIDLVFKINASGNAVKYDFIVHPGADLKQVLLRYQGMDSLQLFDGNLKLNINEKVLNELIPISWIKENGQEIKINFELIASSKQEAIIGFSSPHNLDASQTIVIDPIPQLLWSKYIGDSLQTTTNGIITDRYGFVYICGSTQSMSNIATSGAYQTVLMDSISDAYISKYNSNGVKIWSTYFGGSSNDVANDVYVDTSLNVFLTGTTFSMSGIGDSTSYQDSLSGMSDAFLAKFNASGQMKWATYFGGDSTDMGIKLSTDFLQNIYVGGITRSPAGIADSSNYLSVYSGSTDGFVVKFDSLGNLIWSTYLGGNNEDELSGIAFGDSAVYVCGSTNSADFPAVGTYAQDSLRGLLDGFIVKLDPAGMHVWSTFFGGEQEDAVNGIKVFNNNVYYTGYTASDSSIATSGAFQPMRNGSKDAFIGKMFNSGLIQWGTYYGGDSTEFGVDLFFELDSNLFVHGATTSLNLPVDSTLAFQTHLTGNTDGFLTKFDQTGNHLWSTYFGGPEVETPEAIAVYGNTAIYIAGTTQSDTMIVPETQMSASNEFNSTQEGYFAKFIQGKSTPCSGICSGGPNATPVVISCPGSEVMLTVQGGALGTDAEWVWYESSCGSGPIAGVGDTIFVSPAQTTTYFVRAESITNATTCVFVTVQVHQITPVSINGDTAVCIGSTATLQASGNGMFHWSGPNGFVLNDSDTSWIVSDTSFQGWYILEFTDSLSCQQVDSIFMSVHLPPAFTFEIQQISCNNYADGSIYIHSDSLDQLTWNLNSNADSLSNLAPGTYYLSIVNSHNCSIQDSFLIEEPDSFLIDTLIVPTACQDSSGIIALNVDPAFGPYIFQWNPSVDTGDSISNLPYGVQTVTIMASNACSEIHEFLIPNENGFSVEIGDFSPVSCVGTSDGFATAVATGGSPGYSYSWLPNGETSQTIDSLTQGIYSVTAFDSDGCYAFDTISIQSNANWTLDTLIIPALCSTLNGEIQLIIENPDLIENVVWSNGVQDSISLTNLAGGSYSVSISDTSQCTYEYTFTIPTINDLTVSIVPGNQTIDYGESIDLTGQTSYPGNFMFQWFPNDWLTCSNCQNTTSYPEESITYSIVVSAQNGCVDTAYVTLTVDYPCVEVFIPTIFSPNGDGLNDEWVIIGTCIRSINTKVFNQWGEVIFESSDQSHGWNGRYKNDPVPGDQYTFIVVVELESGEMITRNGTVRVLY